LKLTGYQWFHSPILPLSAWGVYTFGSFPICRLASPRNHTQFTIHHTWYTPSSPYHLEASFLSTFLSFIHSPLWPGPIPFFHTPPFLFFPGLSLSSWPSTVHLFFGYYYSLLFPFRVFVVPPRLALSTAEYINVLRPSPPQPGLSTL
jgi:hypothetical protein